MIAAYREMASIIARFAAEGSHPTAIEGLFLGCHSKASKPNHVTQWPSFALVVQGAKCVTVGGEAHHYGVGDYLLVSLDLPVTSCVLTASEAEPQLGIGLALSPERLSDLLRRIPMPQPQGTQVETRGLVVARAPEELVDATLRLLRLLDRPGDIAAMAPLIEEEILYRLLTGPYGGRLLQIATAESAGNRIAKAIGWLRAHFAQPLRIEELAERAGMSESSLHHHFKAITAMSPIQYQKQLRLQEARRLMLVEQCDVGTAGYAVGYQSPSQFSRDYSRMFGLSPLRDISGVGQEAA